MNKLLNLLDKITLILLPLGLIIVLLISSVDFNCFNFNFFKQEYERLNTAELLDMSSNDLYASTSVLLDYLRDERDGINVVVNIDGIQREAFNSKEAAHMVDVKALYQGAILTRNILLVTSIVAFIYLLIRKRKQLWIPLSVNYIKVSLVFGLCVGLLVIWAVADFNRFWTCFHKVFFTNDLWLLNPNTDLMINLFPSAFFANLVKRIVICFLIGFIGLFIASYLYLKAQLKKGSKT